MGPDEITLPEHERHSAARAAHIEREIETHCKGEYVMDGQHDKVDVQNIFKPGHGGGGDGVGGLGAMAAIAALGGRNEGHRGDGMGLGGGFGAGLVGGLLGGVLFGGGRRGGLFGGEGCEGGGGAETRIEDTIFNTQVLAKLGTIEAAVPLAAAQVENVVLQQTNTITQLASAAQLANQMGFSQTGDRIQNTATALAVAISNVNQNVLEQACQTRAAIAASETAILTRIDRQEIDSLRHERDRFERSVEVNALRSQVEVNQTVTTTQAQAQGQFQVQAQFQDIGATLRRFEAALINIHQEARATNNNVIAGNTGAVTTGAQTSTPTNVVA